MNNLLASTGLELDENQIKIPRDLKRLKIDVGLSVNAPQSEIWLKQDRELMVIGVEPVSSNVAEIENGSSDWSIKLDPKYLRKRMFILPVALSSESNSEGVNFYVTKADPGCSSLLKPKSFEVLRTEKVKVVTLNEILKHFPFDEIGIIDHLKIDTQGSDFDVLKGCSNFLNRIFAITVEIDTDEYEETHNSLQSIQDFLCSYGFVQVKKSFFSNLKFLLKGLKIDVETDDPTFINQNKIHLAKFRRFYLYQRG